MKSQLLFLILITTTVSGFIGSLIYRVRSLGMVRPCTCIACFLLISSSSSPHDYLLDVARL
jgi:hypothetical protein